MGQWLLPSRIFPFYSQKEELTALTSQFPSETLCLFPQYNQVKEMLSIKVDINIPIFIILSLHFHILLV